MAGTVGQALQAKLGLDIGPYRRGLRKANRLAQRTSRTMKRAFAAVAAAAAALGTAITAAIARGVQKAADLEEELTRLETLVGINTDQVSQWRDEILQLAPAVGKGPQQLTEAMFAITSGGARGAEALEILRQSAKASAIGLGNMTDIGRTATAAMQAFGDEGLTATEAIDQMVATVRTGNIEADKLTGALGKVIGIADSMGVSFADMNAFIATFTRLGVDARVASTSLRATLNAMAKPTTDQKAAFQELGTSVAGFREEIQQKGLAQALRDLIQRSQGNIETLSRLVPNVRALSGVLGTAASQGETLSDVQEQVRDALGLTNEGFREARKDLNLLIDRIKAAKDVLLIRVGQQFAPFVERFLGSPRRIKAVADAFIGGVRLMVRSLQGLVRVGRTIASGPVGRILGIETAQSRLARAQGRLTRLRELEQGLASGKRETVGLAGATVGLPASAGLEQVRQRIEEVTNSIDREGGLVDQFENADATFKGVLSTLDELDQALANIDTGGMARSVAGSGGAGSAGSGAGGSGSALNTGPMGIVQSALDGVQMPLQGINTELAKIHEIQLPEITDWTRIWNRQLTFVAQTFVDEIASAGPKIVRGFAKMFDQATRFQKQVQKLREKGFSFGEIAEKLGRPIQEIRKAAEEARDAFQGWGSLLKNIGSSILESVVNALSKAVAKAAALKGLMAVTGGSLFGIPLLGGIFEEGGVVPHAQSGMVVPGSGATPIIAHSGEVVLNREAVQNLGGPQAANAFNQEARGRVTDGLDDRGSGGGLHIHGDLHIGGGDRRTVVTDLEDAIRELERKGRL